MMRKTMKNKARKKKEMDTLKMEMQSLLRVIKVENRVEMQKL